MKLGERPLRVPELPEPHLFLLLALLIGVFSGLAVVCFRVAIETSRLWFLGSQLYPDWKRVLLAPTLVGLGTAIGVRWFFPMVRGSGVNQTKSAVYVYDGFIPFRTVIGKFFASAAAIGSGHSLGPEDPSLQIGAGLASAIGRRIGLTRDRVRLIAPVGAAAGLGAAFNAPITAVLFVIEEVIGTWSAVALGAIIVSAVSGTVVSQWFLGYEPLFRVPAYHLTDARELLWYGAVGILGGGSAVLFVRVVLPARARLLGWGPWTRYLQPAVAGLVVGLIALWAPQVMGAGYEFIDAAMHDQYGWRFMAVLALLKIAATAASFVSGTPGGLFAPTLFIGAMVGGAVAGLARLAVPDLAVSTGAYALIGMGTLFAGILRAPITSVFMIIEVSGNYSIVLPLMISNTIAYLISRRFQKQPIFDVLASQDGLALPSMEEQREATVPRVEDAMAPAPAPVPATDSVAEAIQKVASDGRQWVFFHRDAAGWILITATDLALLASEGKGSLPVSAAFSHIVPAPTFFPDQRLDTVLRAPGDFPLLPVVHRADPRHLLGVVSLEGALAVYRGARRSS